MIYVTYPILHESMSSCLNKARYLHSYSSDSWLVAGWGIFGESDLTVKHWRDPISLSSKLLVQPSEAPNGLGHLWAVYIYIYGWLTNPLEMEVLYGFMGKSWEDMGIPSGNLFHSYWKWPSRNSGFTQLENGGSFHSYGTVYQRVYIYMYIFWVDYNDRTLFSRTLESWFIFGKSIFKWPNNSG